MSAPTTTTTTTSSSPAGFARRRSRGREVENDLVLMSGVSRVGGGRRGFARAPRGASAPTAAANLAWAQDYRSRAGARRARDSTARSIASSRKTRGAAGGPLSAPPRRRCATTGRGRECVASGRGRRNSAQRASRGSCPVQHRGARWCEAPQPGRAPQDGAFCLRWRLPDDAWVTFRVSHGGADPAARRRSSRPLVRRLSEKAGQQGRARDVSAFAAGEGAGQRPGSGADYLALAAVDSPPRSTPALGTRGAAAACPSAPSARARLRLVPPRARATADSRRP